MSTAQEEYNKGSKPAAGFPYGLADLDYWIIRRTDGTVIKHLLENSQGAKKFDPIIHFPHQASGAYSGGQALQKGTQKTISEWCRHDPITPIFMTPPVELYIADSLGAKAHQNDFDIIIDCGKIFTPYEAVPGTRSALTGDPELVEALEHHSIWEIVPKRILKIDWADRAAPDLDPKFWADLASHIKGEVMITCHGGHGRSGTALTCLMLALNPEYSTKDAITHLRAMHCPRAIESVDQHKYIDTVAVSLGRKADGGEIGKVKDFRAAFLSMKHPSAKQYQAKLKGG